MTRREVLVLERRGVMREIADDVLIPHPEEGSEDAALREAIAQAGGAQAALGIVVVREGSWVSTVGRDMAPMTDDYGFSIRSVPSTNASPSRTSRIRASESVPSTSIARERSSVRSWVTFTIHGRGSFASPFRRRTLPGIAESRSFEVIAATMTVLIALRLKRSS